MTKGNSFIPYESEISKIGVSSKYYGSRLSDFKGPNSVVEFLKEYCSDPLETERKEQSIYLFTNDERSDSMGLLAACLAKIFYAHSFDVEVTNTNILCDLMMTDNGIKFDEVISKDFLVIENVATENLNKGVTSAFCNTVLRRKKNNLLTVITSSNNLVDLCSEDAYGMATYHTIDRDYHFINID